VYCCFFAMLSCCWILSVRRLFNVQGLYSSDASEHSSSAPMLQATRITTPERLHTQRYTATLADGIDYVSSTGSSQCDSDFLIRWISDAHSQGCSDLQSLISCLGHGDIVAQYAVMQGCVRLRDVTQIVMQKHVHAIILRSMHGLQCYLVERPFWNDSCKCQKVSWCSCRQSRYPCGFTI